MTQKELRDRQAKYDAYISNIGQKEAKRYLTTREEPPTKGNIRDSLIFLVCSIVVIVFILAL
jgi:hypothetical protein